MKIVVIAGRVSSLAWMPGDVVVRVTRALVERGHEVHVIAQSVDDPPQLHGCASVRAMHRFEQSASDFPVGFASWAWRQRREIAHDRSLSFSRVVPAADVWMPLDPTARSWLGDLLAARGVIRSGPTVLKHGGVLAELVTPAALRGRPRCVLAPGAVAAQGARRAALGADVREIEFFSSAQVPSQEDAARVRARVRAMLGVPRECVLIATGTTGRVGPSLRGLLSEVAQAHGPMSPIAGPMLVFLTREQFPVHTMGLKAGAEKFVRVVGMSASARDVIIASDAAAIPSACSRGAFDAGAMGRLAATALRLGKPLIAAAGAPGAELCLRRASDHSECGTVVDGSFGSWRRALRLAADPAWREKTASAAAEVGRKMTAEAMVRSVIAAIEG